jgi:4-hydroxy-tetrahydrodipicolinate synthase
MRTLHGIHTALITPFTDDDAVDWNAFAALVQRQLDGGIHGLVPCGTTGETPTLTQDEVDDVIRATVEIAAGTVPVTAGVGANSTKLAVQNTERVAKLGVDAGLLVFPWYNKPNPDGLRAHVRAVAAVGLPIVLYHVPGRTAQHLPASLLGELCEIDGVVGVKEATGDVSYGTDLMLATSRPVFSGDDFTFLGLLAQGGAGCTSVVSNLDPAGTVAVYDHFRAGRNAEARDAMHRLFPLVRYLFSEVSPVPAKAAMAAMGLCRPHPRLPLAPSTRPAPTPLLTALGLL